MIWSLVRDAHLLIRSFSDELYWTVTPMLAEFCVTRDRVRQVSESSWAFLMVEFQRFRCQNAWKAFNTSMGPWRWERNFWQTLSTWECVRCNKSEQQSLLSAGGIVNGCQCLIIRINAWFMFQPFEGIETYWKSHEIPLASSRGPSLQDQVKARHKQPGSQVTSTDVSPRTEGYLGLIEIGFRMF